MKKSVSLGFFFLGLVLTCQAQLSRKAALDSIAERLQRGIYERTINLGYISSTVHTSRKKVPVPHNEFTMMIMRFSELSYDPVSGNYIGKVFVGERYLESHYNKKYNSVAAYINDKDGFYMACKLFYHEHSMEYRLHVYPDYVMNICNESHDPFTGMHFNTRVCDNTATHLRSIRFLAALDDESYNSINEENDSTQISNFLRLATALKLNIDTNFINKESRFSDLSGRKRNMLREINLRKHIKCFRVGDFFDSPSDMAKTLKIRYTKYSLSEDILENADYDFHFLDLSPSQNTYLKWRGTNKVFITRNPLYRSLVVSFEPDETYIPEIPKLNINTYYDQGVTTVIPFKNNKNTNTTTEQKVNTQIYLKQILLAVQLSKQPAVTPVKRPNLVSAALPLSLTDSLQKNFINVVSEDPSPMSWIYWPKAQKINDTLTIQRETYLRADYPKQLEHTSGWLRGGIKGVALQGDLYQVDSVMAAKKHIWLRVKKVEKVQSEKKLR